MEKAQALPGQSDPEFRNLTTLPVASLGQLHGCAAPAPLRPRPSTYAVHGRVKGGRHLLFRHMHPLNRSPFQRLLSAQQTMRIFRLSSTAPGALSGQEFYASSLWHVGSRQFPLPEPSAVETLRASTFRFASKRGPCCRRRQPGPRFLCGTRRHKFELIPVFRIIFINYF